MKIEIDQSWKLEFTNRQTVIADSIGNSVSISSKDKKLIKQFFRINKMRKQYVDQVFAAMLAFLICRTFNKSNTYIVDIEYPAHMGLIKHYTIRFLGRLSKTIQGHQIQLAQITKKSKAHYYAHQTYNKKKVTTEEMLTSTKILNLILSTDKKRS